MTASVVIKDLLKDDFVLVLVNGTGFDHLLMCLLLVLVSIHFYRLAMLHAVRHLVHILSQMRRRAQVVRSPACTFGSAVVSILGAL